MQQPEHCGTDKGCWPPISRRVEVTEELVSNTQELVQSAPVEEDFDLRRDSSDGRASGGIEALDISRDMCQGNLRALGSRGDHGVRGYIAANCVPPHGRCLEKRRALPAEWVKHNVARLGIGRDEVSSEGWRKATDARHYGVKRMFMPPSVLAPRWNHSQAMNIPNRREICAEMLRNSFA